MLGIIVVVYKNFDGTVSFVNKELKKITVEYKCVVVNNAASNEETQKLAKACDAEYVSSSQDPIRLDNKLFVIGSNQNLGYAKGNNWGVEFLSNHFTIDYYLFSNDDIEIRTSEDVNLLIETLKIKTDSAIVGPKIVHLDGSIVEGHFKPLSIYRLIGWNLLPFLRKKRTIKNQNIETKISECYWVSGCFFLIKATIFEKIQGFDPNTFLYMEEAILSERVLSTNHKIYYNPLISIIHYQGESTKKNLSYYKTKKTLLKSQCYYYRHYRKHSKLLIGIYYISTHLNKWIFK